MVKKDVIDFVGIGSAKSGSTWLAKCLNEHPDILFSEQKSRKGLMFFQKKGYLLDRFSNYKKGIKWYLSQFPPAQKNTIRGEYTIDYLTDPYASKLIKQHFPNVKLIVALRNPADMIYSLFWYLKAFSPANIQVKLPEEFDDIFKNKEVEKFLLPKGLYYKHLKNYLKYFSKDRIHVILYDDVVKNSDKVLKKLYSFLRVDKNFKPSFLNKKVNTAPTTRYPTVKRIVSLILDFLRSIGLGKFADWLTWNRLLQRIYRFNVTRVSYKPISNHAKRKLIKYYKNDITKLERLVNLNLSSWKK